MKLKKPVEVIPIPTKEDEEDSPDEADDGYQNDDDEDDDDDNDDDDQTTSDDPQDDAEEMQRDEANDDDDDDDDEDYGDNSDGSTTAKPKISLESSTSYHKSSTPKSGPATPDPYFTHFDPRIEHQAYKEAQLRLEELHREKVTKVRRK